MTTYRLASIPGDGVGPEVWAAAQAVLMACAGKFSFTLDVDTYPWGCDYCVEHGCMMPHDALDTLRDNYDAIFLGCMGDPTKVPDHVSIDALHSIRTQLGQYANVRPIQLHEGVDTPVTTCTPETVNMVVVRENTEGEYARLGGLFYPEQEHGFATQLGFFSRVGCRRVMRYAFELARERKKAGGRGLVTSCTKSNSLNYSMVFWDSIFAEVAQEYPDIETNAMLADALSMVMIQDPGRFDVIVASNLFGDIITDLGSVLQGGIGLAAGANLNPDRTTPSMFEPIHGSALALAGKNCVNPLASIESARLMLDFLGEKDAAAAMLAAIKKVLAARQVRTGDMGGTSTTTEVAEAVIAAL
ncbi:isocitrate/isopropylmalate dehydrogenase family protein [Desulfocurvus sp. DL9XJH121]